MKLIASIGICGPVLGIVLARLFIWYVGREDHEDNLRLLLGKTKENS